LYGR